MKSLSVYELVRQYGHARVGETGRSNREMVLADYPIAGKFRVYAEYTSHSSIITMQVYKIGDVFAFETVEGAHIEDSLQAAFGAAARYWARAWRGAESPAEWVGRA